MTKPTYEQLVSLLERCKPYVDSATESLYVSPANILYDDLALALEGAKTTQIGPDKCLP